MSFFDRVIDGFFESRARVNGSAADWDRDVQSMSTPTASGVDVGPEKARTLMAVWACQSLIADGVSTLPVDVFSADAKGIKKPVTAPPWLKNPNPFDTPYTFWHKVMLSLLGEGGNAYVMVGRGSNGKVASLWVLDPARCDVDENSATPIVLYDGIPYGPESIIHIPAFVVPYQRKGLSVIDNARESIGLGLAAQEFGARFFGQGTTMSGVVEHPGKASPGELTVISRMMRKTHSGVANSHIVGVLAGGATFKPISVNPDQAQFLETRGFQNREIAIMYRVPVHMIDPTVTSTWGSGVEEQNKSFVDDTLVPWLTRLEQAFSRLLPRNQVLKFNVDARLRAKTLERYQSYVMAVNNGLMTLDEVRALEDLDPIDGGKGEKHYVPANLVELGEKPVEATGGVPANGGMQAATNPDSATNKKKPETDTKQQKGNTS